MSNPTNLFLILIFSAIGTGYFIYGYKQRRLIPLLAGVVLSFYPYFFSNPWIIFIVGTMISIVPYFVRL